MLKLMAKKIFTILSSKVCLSKPMHNIGLDITWLCCGSQLFYPWIFTMKGPYIAKLLFIHL